MSTLATQVTICNIRKHGMSGCCIASCTARPNPDCTFLLVCIFEGIRITQRELCQKQVAFQKEDGSVNMGILCVGWSDEAYKRHRNLSQEEYHQQVGRWYDGALYREDLLPCKPYLDRCIAAHAHVSEQFWTISWIALFSGTTKPRFATFWIGPQVC